MTVWDAVTGQAEAVAELQGASRAARSGPGGPGSGMTHAWLITGPAGSGRSIAARAFAAALVCRTPATVDGVEIPGCGHCNPCLTVLDGTAADVQVIGTEGTWIRIDTAREMVRVAGTAPVAGTWRIVIVEDADRFQDGTANVLLKTLEEPPPRTVFLLCAPSDSDVLPTVRSRCRTVRLRMPRAADVAAVLTEQGVDPALAAFTAQAAQGHIGRARRLATDADARGRRAEVLKLPIRLRSVGECLAAAADLVEATAQESAAAAQDRDSGERAELEELLTASREGSGGRRKAGGSQMRMRGAAGAVKELEAEQKRRARRSQFDALDRALQDLAGWYRDVLACQLGALNEAGAIHPDQSDMVARAARAWRPPETLRRLDAIMAARQLMIDLPSMTPLLAMEALTLQLRSG
jgi:DNA polymerase-3 subunit delta'